MTIFTGTGGNDIANATTLLGFTGGSLADKTDTIGDWIIGLDGNDDITGGAGLDLISGGDGNDILRSSAGSDLLIGGKGDDTFYITGTAAAAASTVSEELDGGYDTVRLASYGGSFTLAYQVEALVVIGGEASGSTSFTAIGNDLDNTFELLRYQILNAPAFQIEFYGGKGNDHFKFYLGAAVTAYGGEGNDTYDIGQQNLGGWQAIEEADQGIDTLNIGDLNGLASLSLAGTNIENATVFGNAGKALLLEGDSADNILEVRFVPKGVQSGLKNNTLRGFDGNDTIKGWKGVDIIEGGNGSDTLEGRGGNDVIDGGFGADTINGGDGDDVLSDSSADGTINMVDGGAGNDRLVNAYIDYGGIWDGGDGIDTIDFSQETYPESFTIDISASSFILWVTTFRNFENVIGHQDDDVITGSSGINRLDGQSGDDTINGGSGSDVIVGGDGDDVLTGGLDEDVVRGGYGSDTITESDLNIGNTLYGDAGNDHISGGGGADTIFGGTGNDSIEGGLGGDFIDGGSGNDKISDLVLGSTNDIRGGLGNDSIILNASLTNGGSFDGGVGNDTIDLRQAFIQGPLVIDLRGASFTVATGGVFKNFENAFGSSADDTLLGSTGANRLNGFRGADVISGGEGRDILTGGTGNDSFVFDSALGASNVDVITDFTAGRDKIHLKSSGIFTALTETGPLAASSFALGSSALELGSRVLFDSATSTLFYDADGTGDTAAVAFAKLTGLVGTLSASDFTVI